MRPREKTVIFEKDFFLKGQYLENKRLKNENLALRSPLYERFGFTNIIG